MNGIDVSEWDVGRHPGLDWVTFFAGYDFVIVRVANENGGMDRYADLLVDAAKRSGKPWGLYAWPVVGWSWQENRNWARMMVEQFGVGQLGLAADAERSPRGFADASLVEAFCLGAKDAGALPVYYCATMEVQHTPLLDSVAWWVADYSQNDGAYHAPEAQWPYPDRPWQLHQYTSVGWPGGGPLDVNYCQSLDWAGAAPAPVPVGKRADMTILWIEYNGMNVYLVQAGVIVKQFRGDGPYGIPQDAYDFDAHTSCGIGGMSGGEWSALLKRSGIT